MPDTLSATRSTGRPRDPGVHNRILAAARAELGEKGLDGMTLSAVALRAGVSKTSVVRRWTDVAGLVTELLGQLRPPPAVPDLGDLHAELDLLSRVLAQELTTPNIHRQLRFTLSASRYPALFARYQDAYVRPLAELSRGVMNRAVDRGLTSPDADIPVLSSAFFGALTNSAIARGCGGPAERDRRRIVDTFARLLGAT